jgi:hypothetical protein
MHGAEAMNVRIAKLRFLMITAGVVFSSWTCREGKLLYAHSREVDLETIVKTWQRREEAVKTARFWWNQRLTKGGRLPSPGGKKAPGTESEAPPVTILENVALSVDGAKINYIIETTGGGSEFAGRRYRGTYNGTTSQMLLSGGTAAFPSATVRKTPYGSDKDSLSLAAFSLAFRPLHPGFGQLNPKDLRVAPGARRRLGFRMRCPGRYWARQAASQRRLG